jgi:hypothetical protein
MPGGGEVALVEASRRGGFSSRLDDPGYPRSGWRVPAKQVERRPRRNGGKGRFTPSDPLNRGQARAYPVVANGRLYIRDLGTLWCYDVKASATGKWPD